MRGFASADLPAHGSIRPAGAMRAKLRDNFSRAWKGPFLINVEMIGMQAYPADVSSDCSVGTASSRSGGNAN
jgi:hypothetical protein